VSDVVSTAKAAKWTGFSERTIRTWCKEKRLEGAYQFQNNGKWLIPTSTLENIRACPEWLLAELSEVA
jgi:hypothetical protein